MDFFFLYLDCVLFLTAKIKNSKIGNVKKLINVKSNGLKLNIVTAPAINGAKNITNNLLFSKVVKLNLKSFFQFCSFCKNLYFEYDHNLLNVKVHAPKPYRIQQRNFFFTEREFIISYEVTISPI